VKRRISASRPDDGQVLLAVLIFLIIFAVVVGVLLSQATSSFVLNEATQTQSKLLYAADSGLEWGISDVGPTAQCPNDLLGSGRSSPISMPGVGNVTVSCTQATGPGSNLYAGQYALITGLGYGSQSATNGGTGSDGVLGSKTCQSISTDPLNPGKPTDATFSSAKCLTYPSSSGTTTVWTNDTSGNNPIPPNNVTLNSVFGLDSTDTFIVGNESGNATNAWYYDGDDFTNLLPPGDVNLCDTWAADTSHMWAVGGAGANCSPNNAAKGGGGMISTSTSSTLVTGSGPTNFTTTLAVGEALYKNDGTTFIGTVASITDNTHLNLSANAAVALANQPYDFVSLNIVATGNGNVTTTTSSAAVTGNGPTQFTTQLAVGDSLYKNDGATYIGTVASITDNSHLTLTANAAVALNNQPFDYALAGTVMECTAGCSTTTPTWLTESLPSGTPELTDIFGTSASAAYAVGVPRRGQDTILSFNSGTDSWSALGTPPSGATVLQGVLAANGDVWAVGSTGNSGSMLLYNGSSWSTVTLPSGTGPLLGLSGVNSSGTEYLWAVTAGGVLACTAGCATASPTWASSSIPGATLTSIAAGDTGDVWAVASNGNAYYCSSSCNQSGSTWTSQTTGATNLQDVSAAQLPPGSCYSGNVWAVGQNGGVFTYTPVCPGVVNAKVTVSGGDVFNGSAMNLVQGLDVKENFYQFDSSGAACTNFPKPSQLKVDGSIGYTCTNSVPSSLQTLQEAFPSTPPANSPNQNGTTVSVSGVSGCPDYVVFTPGTYTGHLNFSANTTYFFESGLYYFTGGFGAFDNGPGTGTDNLYIIGGHPSQGDPVSVAQNSPCWSTIKASTYFTAGTGTGVEWILGAASWMDVHTVNLELFTREGGNTSIEGAQGISVREVPPFCSGAQTGSPDGWCAGSKWLPSCSNSTSNPNQCGNNQLFQVDANDHEPNVFVHGALYMPDNNVEEYTGTTSTGVTLGPIDCDSLELSFQSSSTKILQIEAGTGNPVVALIATATSGSLSFSEEAVYGIETTGQSASVLNWWVCRNTAVTGTTQPNQTPCAG